MTEVVPQLARGAADIRILLVPGIGVIPEIGIAIPISILTYQALQQLVRLMLSG